MNSDFLDYVVALKPHWEAAIPGGILVVHELAVWLIPAYQQRVGERLPLSWRWIAIVTVVCLGAVWASFQVWRTDQLRVAQAAQCKPQFEWRHEDDAGFHPMLDIPVLIKYALVVPTSPEPYHMTVKADGGGLQIFNVQHENQKDDPKPWQLTPSGIGYRAIKPVWTIGFVLVAKNPRDVRLDIEFGCIKR